MRKITQTIVGTTPPLDKNVLWLDTTNSNEPVQKLFLDGEWRPLKDADADAEFISGQKVSELSVQISGTASADDNKKLPTKQYVDQHVDGKRNLPTYAIAEPKNGTITITCDDSAPYNYVVSPNADIIEIEIGRHSEQTNVTDVYDYVTTIRFNSTATPTTIVYDDTELNWVNEALPICEENVEYLIAIWKNIGVMTKVALIPLENSNS